MVSKIKRKTLFKLIDMKVRKLKRISTGARKNIESLDREKKKNLKKICLIEEKNKTIEAKIEVGKTLLDAQKVADEKMSK